MFLHTVATLLVLLLLAGAAALAVWAGLAGVYDGRSVLAFVMAGVAGMIWHLIRKGEGS